MRLVLSPAVGLAAAAKLDPIALFEQILHLVAGIAGVSIETTALRQVYFHGLEGGDVDKGAGVDVELDRHALQGGDDLDAETVEVAPLAHAFAPVGLSLEQMGSGDADVVAHGHGKGVDQVT